MLLAFVEIAWRGYGWWAFFALLLWMPLVWRARPAQPRPQELLLGPHTHRLWRAGAVEPITIELLAGTVLLPSVVVLHWRPIAGRGRHFLWLWARDLGADSFGDLRRWWLVYGQKRV